MKNKEKAATGIELNKINKKSLLQIGELSL